MKEILDMLMFSVFIGVSISIVIILSSSILKDVIHKFCKPEDKNHGAD